MAKAIGPTFPAELEAAGLTGLPFSWTAEGTFIFSEGMTQAQIAAVMVVYDAHDPTKPLPVNFDANTRIDAGILAALTTAVAAAGAIHAIPNNFTAANFAQLLAQMKIFSDAFVSMLQAQAATSNVGGGKPPTIGKPPPIEKPQ